MKQATATIGMLIQDPAQPRRLMAMLLLFSLVFQAFIFANHFDGNPSGLAGAATEIGPGLTHSGGDRPSKDDGFCLICHQIAQAGQFVTPSASALLPPTMIVSVIALTLPLLRLGSAQSHSWQGRAPPRQ
jgi:hypothetical protein